MELVKEMHDTPDTRQHDTVNALRALAMDAVEKANPARHRVLLRTAIAGTTVRSPSIVLQAAAQALR
jgi:hypothetical protein